MPKDDKEDPWMVMETELETRARSMLDIRERYLTAVKEAEQPDGKPMRADGALKVKGLLIQLENELQETQQDIEVMKRSLDAALENPERCKVTPAELARRQDVFANITRKIQKCQHEVFAGHRAEDKRWAATVDDKPSTASVLIEEQMQEQQRAQVSNQAALERIGHSLVSVENKGHLIGGALDDSNKRLAALDQDMSRVAAKMDTVITKVDAMLNRTSDKGKIAIIGCLMVVLVVLVVVLFGGSSSASASSS